MGVLSLYDDFWEDIPKGTNPEPGHVYWVPVRETNQTTRILDVERSSPEEHHGVSFRIVDIEDKHFKKRGDRLPIKKLDLKETEELIIEKGKLRPTVIISISSVGGIDSLPNGKEQRSANHLSKQSYYVAPLYSISHVKDPGTFGPTLVMRIRTLQYPQFMCTKDFDNSEDPSKVIRLDRIFSSYLGRGCTPYNKKLNDELFTLLLAQTAIIYGVHDPELIEAFNVTREIVQEASPE